jgi:hypothetical protein
VSGNHYLLDGNKAVQEHKSRLYPVIEMSNTGIIMTNNKELQNNLQLVYDYGWKMVMLNIPATYILHITSILKLVSLSQL